MTARRAEPRTGIAFASLASFAACATPPAHYAPPSSGAPQPPTVLQVERPPEKSAEPVRVPETCHEGSTLYLLSTKGDLYALEDLTPTFRLLGATSCQGLRVDAMAFDREGELWLTSHDGGLYRLLPDTLACSPNIDRSGAFSKGGYGIAWTQQAIFASDNPHAGAASAGLFRVDRARVLEGKGQAPAFLGAFTDGLRGRSADLAFDDEGHLYGLFNTQPLTFTSVDETRATTPKASQRVLPGTVPGSWAVTFWNREFWLFTAAKDPDQDEYSEIWKLDQANGTPQKLKTRTGFYVLGAGKGPCSKFTRPAKEPPG
ncbi:MAG: hypothetical protein U0174_25140 [Polyangiaceae bacterium]